MTPNKLALCVCLAMLVWVANAEEFTTAIPQGSLKGIKSTTILRGKPMYSFKGIPYAKPNVGPDKFRISEPADSWDGVLDATEHRSNCVFYCMLRKGIVGDEDCLYLNVYTPEVNENARKAVMVFLHPGGFNTGTGSDDLFGPDFLVENDVVVVTFNFRLGALGFLNTGDASAPGNAGLKDQALALKWVRDNIYLFGGCAHRITIFGQSSGGASVQYHMMSPMTQGLIKNAIMQSGSAETSWAYTNTPRDAAFKLGESLGIKTTCSLELTKKLAEFSAQELVEASGKIALDENHINGVSYVFVPSAEADVGQEIFLSADPWVLLKSGKLADVPLMTGITADEAAFFTGLVLDQASMVEDNPETFIPNDLNITDAAERKKIGEAIKKFYYKGKPISSETKQETIDVLSDVMFNYGMAMTAKIIADRNTAPVYQYLFSFHAPFGFMKGLFGVQEGVAHGDEMTYQFYGKAFKNLPVAGSDEEKITEIMCELWTNFAKGSNPTPNTDGVVKVNWEPMGREGNYMDINVEPTMKKEIIKDRVNFWADLYKSVLGDYAKLFN